MRLPGAYVTALRMAGEGAHDEAIAAEVGIAEEAVPALLELAASKLGGVLAERWVSRQGAG